MPSLHPTLLSQGISSVRASRQGVGIHHVLRASGHSGELTRRVQCFLYLGTLRDGWSCLWRSLKCLTEHFLIGCRGMGISSTRVAISLWNASSGFWIAAGVARCAYQGSCAAGPKTPNVAASLCDWACVLAAVREMQRAGLPGGLRDSQWLRAGEDRGGISATGWRAWGGPSAGPAARWLATPSWLGEAIASAAAEPSG
jgi:hypothetical protein